MRECRKCHESFPETDFALTYSIKGGRRRVCKRCRQARTNELYPIHSSKRRTTALASYYKNAAKYHERAKAWALANPEKVKQSRRATDAKRKNNDSRRKQRRETTKRLRIQLRLKNPSLMRWREAQHGKRLRRLAIRDLTQEQWRQRLEEFGHHCAYCWASDVKLTKDHLIPITRGGQHTIDNIVPACQPCNTRKKNHSMLEVLRLVS